jgi:hypothetical protein
MNYKKVLSILFFVLTFGAIKEALRVFTSSDPDIIENRSWLLPMSVIIPVLFFYSGIRYWRKSSK